MDLGIAGRTALVTAGSKGLGLASAIALAADGANVVVCGRNADNLEAAGATIAAAQAASGRGGGVEIVAADVTDPVTPAQLVARTLDVFGALHILVANAGGPPPGRALDVSDDAILEAVNANLLSTVRLVRAALVPMRAAGWGRICAIASVSIKEPIPSLALSNTARTGLWAWAKTAARDLAPEGITLNLACPGFHATDRIKALGHTSPDSRLGDPAGFGNVVAFLCSAHAGFVSGTALAVDGAGIAGLL